MLRPIRAILFATDLTVNCQQALEYTIAIASRFKARIYMLHVLDQLPENARGPIISLLGNHQWEDLVNSHHESAKKSLLGKQNKSQEIRQALQEFCQQQGIADSGCDFQSSEIIISDGELVKDILHYSEKNDCDLIVMGGHRNIFGKVSMGSTYKGVVKNSGIPVTIAPGVRNTESLAKTA